MPWHRAIGYRVTATHTRKGPAHGPNIRCAPDRGGSGIGRKMDLPQHSLAQGGMGLGCRNCPLPLPWGRHTPRRRTERRGRYQRQADRQYQGTTHCA